MGPALPILTSSSADSDAGSNLGTIALGRRQPLEFLEFTFPHQTERQGQHWILPCNLLQGPTQKSFREKLDFPDRDAKERDRICPVKGHTEEQRLNFRATCHSWAVLGSLAVSEQVVLCP